MRRRVERAALVSVVGSAAGLAWLDLRLRRRPSVTPPAEPGRHAVRVVETRRVVPGPGLPASVATFASNNNLDAVRHSDGFVHRAFRTAPHHFASPHVAIQVVRSRDEVTWESEARFALGHAARRPATSRTGPAARIAASTTRPSCSGTTARRTWSDGAT